MSGKSDSSVRVTLETTKRQSSYLRGTLAEELGAAGPGFGEDASQLLKFHGIYQQDDRDLRQGGDRTRMFMVRASLPGGFLSAEQYLVADELADVVGDGTIRITSRQGLQWHRVGKADLRTTLWILNHSLVTTFGACGDVVRNVVACPDPLAPPYLTEIAADLAERFRPRSMSYWELWVDGERAVSANEDIEPIYGATYLPRKFKIGIAAPGDNCVDVLTHDLGLIPVGDRWVVTVGGGQGMSHNRPDTYPRLGDPIATVDTGQIGPVAEAVVGVQRDWGNRQDRKLARLKYLIDTWGIARFRAAVAERLDHRLDQTVPFEWTSHGDHLGWVAGPDGSLNVGVNVETGRISGRMRAALADVIEKFRPNIRLTPQQNLILTGLDPSDRAEIDRRLQTNTTTRMITSTAMACVALPTCGLALTDAERAFPQITIDLAGVLTGLGLAEDSVTLRITGCPNGCVRPYTAEIGVVGRRSGRYDIHLGAAADGTRLGERVIEKVPVDKIAATLEPLLKAWSHDGNGTFGDFCHRQGPEGLAGLLPTTGIES